VDIFEARPATLDAVHTRPARLAFAITDYAVTGTQSRDSPELLDVDVHQLAGCRRW
jgi:hypothetical protein